MTPRAPKPKLAVWVLESKPANGGSWSVVDMDQRRSLLVEVMNLLNKRVPGSHRRLVRFVRATTKKGKKK